MVQKFHKKKKQYRNLIYGFVWFALVFSKFIFKEDYSLSWVDYGWIVLGLLQIGLYFFEHNLAYVIIEKDVITIYTPFAKRIDINDIIEIKKFPTNYILRTKNKELKINPEYINEEDLANLDSFLDGLQLKTA